MSIENLKLNEKQITLEEIKELAKNTKRLVYGSVTCWWKVGDPVYTANEDDSLSLPCGPRGEMLLETNDPISFIELAESNIAHYGKHGIDAFVLAYHENVVTLDGKPTSLDHWDYYNNLFDLQKGDS